MISQSIYVKLVIVLVKSLNLQVAFLGKYDLVSKLIPNEDYELL